MAEKNTLLFLELNDGSTPKNLQVRRRRGAGVERSCSLLLVKSPTTWIGFTSVAYSAFIWEGGGFTLQVLVKDGVYALEALKHTGTCVVVEGEMKASPEGASQKAELHATAIKSVGPCVPPPIISLFLATSGSHAPMRVPTSARSGETSKEGVRTSSGPGSRSRALPRGPR
jgi:aspartyl/asparaginyl-tRNA synthetase